MVFYNWSGGMESSAMLVVDRERIRETGAIVCWADTGKQFPEMAASKAQIEVVLELEIVTVPPIKTFDDYLFKVGPKGGTGMLRRGVSECSQVMKRRPLKYYHQTFPKPWEINIGFNAAEQERADSFTERNEREWCHWRYPLIEAGVERAGTWGICRKAGFTILVGMYEKMGRFDCFWCPNQKVSQALKVAMHYPDLAAEWMDAERRKGHSFLRVPLAQLIQEKQEEESRSLFPGCSCFGGTDDVWEEDGF